MIERSYPISNSTSLLITCFDNTFLATVCDKEGNQIAAIPSDPANLGPHEFSSFDAMLPSIQSALRLTKPIEEVIGEDDLLLFRKGYMLSENQDDYNPSEPIHVIDMTDVEYIQMLQNGYDPANDRELFDKATLRTILCDAISHLCVSTDPEETQGILYSAAITFDQEAQFISEEAREKAIVKSWAKEFTEALTEEDFQAINRLVYTIFENYYLTEYPKLIEKGIYPLPVDPITPEVITAIRNDLSAIFERYQGGTNTETDALIIQESALVFASHLNMLSKERINDLPAFKESLVDKEIELIDTWVAANLGLKITLLPHQLRGGVDVLSLLPEGAEAFDPRKHVLTERLDTDSPILLERGYDPVTNRRFDGYQHTKNTISHYLEHILEPALNRREDCSESLKGIAIFVAADNWLIEEHILREVIGYDSKNLSNENYNRIDEWCEQHLGVRLSELPDYAERGINPFSGESF